MSCVGNKQKQNNRALKDNKQVRLKLMADIFLGPYSKLGVPRIAEQKTKKDMLRWRLWSEPGRTLGLGASV